MTYCSFLQVDLTNVSTWEEDDVASWVEQLDRNGESVIANPYEWWRKGGIKTYYSLYIVVAYSIMYR